MEDKEIIKFLRDFGMVGLISINPSMDELLVPWSNAVTELNFYCKTNYSEEDLKKILKRNAINRRTPEEFIKLKKQAKGA